MVFHKRLDYGSNGHQVPPMPRVPLSARGKRSARKKIEDKQMCAFDLLATVAGEILSEERGNALPLHKGAGTSNPPIVKDDIKKEHVGNEKSFKAEVFDQGSCNESTAVSEKHASYDLKNCSLSPRATGKDASEPMGTRKMSEFDIPKKDCIEGCYSGLKASRDCKLDIGIKTPLKAEPRMIGNIIDENGLMDVDAKPPALVSSDSSVDIPIPRNGSFAKCGNGAPADRDDDENSSGCTHPRSNISKVYRPQHIGDHRVRKLLGSKFWKVAPTSKDGELSNAEKKPIYRNRKLCYTRERTQRCSFKRRKSFALRSISASDLDIFGEGVYNSPNLGGIKMETTNAHASQNQANGASPSRSGQKSSYESGDYHVKLSIKSFKVPELFIEIPENATVASLKRTVMEAVTAILGGGLRVGVLLQGKKVRDDNKTLLQTGISHNDKMDNLGFSLEPSAKKATPSLLCPEDPNSIVLSDVIEPLKGIQAADPILELAAALEATPQAPQTSTLNCLEGDHDSVRSPADVSSADKMADSKALVPVPAGNVDAFAVVPIHKSRRTELVPRRIRRPFSVSEVEALVQAVEKLGTGRWRDVKLRAFDNAKHRTYVDLKDKWKTLVHTARISPQQRRGEPVPQELLDRVLSAHAYWSHQQAKLQAKSPPAEACLLA